MIQHIDAFMSIYTSKRSGISIKYNRTTRKGTNSLTNMISSEENILVNHWNKLTANLCGCNVAQICLPMCTTKRKQHRPSKKPEPVKGFHGSHLLPVWDRPPYGSSDVTGWRIHPSSVASYPALRVDLVLQSVCWVRPGQVSITGSTQTQTNNHPHPHIQTI